MEACDHLRNYAKMMMNWLVVLDQRGEPGRIRIAAHDDDWLILITFQTAEVCDSQVAVRCQAPIERHLIRTCPLTQVRRAEVEEVVAKWLLCLVSLIADKE